MLFRLGWRLVQFQRTGDQLTQALQVNGLGQKVERPCLECIDSGIQAAVCGDHGNGRAWAVLLDMPHYAHTIAIGQTHVGQAECVLIAAQQRESLGHSGCALRAYVHARKRHIQQLKDVGLVVDDQNGRFGHVCLECSLL